MTLSTLLKIFTGIMLVCFINSCKTQSKTSENIMPPKAKKISQELTIHGHTRIDDYYWLNERESPEVIRYLNEENNYLDHSLAHTKEFQENLYNEIIGRIKQTDESVPYKDNGYYYYNRYVAGKEYPLYCRKKGALGASEEIMLDVNKMAEGHNYYQVKGLNVSENNKLLAFGVDTVSRRIYTIYIKNLETGEIYPDKIGNTTGSSVWANDNKTLFFTSKDSTLRPDMVFCHTIGSETNELVYHEKDNTFAVYLWKSKSRKYIYAFSNSTLSTEMQFLDAGQPNGTFKIIQKREKDHEYSVVHFKDNFYILTNWNAKNFRLMKTHVNRPEKENWIEVIAHRENILLNDVEIFKDFMVISERKDGLTRIRIINNKSQKEHYLDFGEPAYKASISINKEFDTNLLRYNYTSLTTPNSKYDYNMEKREQTLLKRDEVIGDFDPGNYITERTFARANDGAKVPISLVYKKGLKKDAENPVLLYGYGSYGYTIDPSFSSVRLSLLDRGFVFAIAHVRGGQALGRKWYEDGKLLKKKNTFTDFIACAEELINQKYSNQNKMFAMGGSAGGLLMGAVLNMRPDLWKGVVAAVPFVDVVTTMLDESIPLTTGEFDEWGNPKEKKFYDYILSYSPYDNVKKNNYPAMLVTTGLHDSQVQYWEPAKWVAKLRVNKTDKNPLFLFTEMEAGHGGASGRFEQYKTIALEYAFILDLLGINQ
ncbi:MAG: S9 family peptidase [Calditrichaeota bacterium]|nr:MAG: S9 family peptidase [Calditrichota bacterium]MBL1205746.1 S9 family peptidase [Calditrichota bacterium]NOG45574.1 S9 family peptidase [Calditrichota bacterium]